MPIYEFYCPDCNTIFSFYSRTVARKKVPSCPRCGKKKLEKQVSTFAVTGKAVNGQDSDNMPFDEEKMEKACEALSHEVGRVDENDPRQAAQLMRRFSNMTGMKLGQTMDEALGRIEAGENPEALEQEMGDRLSEDELFLFEQQKRIRNSGRQPPVRDETLYDL